MTTIAQIRDRISRRLSGDGVILMDRLNGAVANTTTETITVEFANAALAEGTVIEIGTELLYVISRTNFTVTVLRGWNGSTATSHADNALVYINPRWSAMEIIELLGEELRSWPIQLGRVATEEVELAAHQVQVSLTATGLDVWRVLDIELLHSLRRGRARRDRVDFTLLYDPDGDDFTSKWAIQLAEPFARTQNLQVTYLSAYDLSALTTTSTDLETTVGLDARLLDVLIYGVMWRAVSTREVLRTDQAATQLADREQVPPTHLLQTSTALKQIRDRRIAEEVTRTYDRFPVLMTTGG